MRFRTTLTTIALIAVTSLTFAQDPQEMLRGSGHPLTLRPDGLGMNYRAIQIKSTVAGSNGFLDMLMNPMMMLMGALGSMGGTEKDGPPTALLTALDITWTTGATEQFFGETYLVVYKLDIDLTKMSAGPPKNLEDTNLRLSYIRTDTIASITPRPDITTVDFMRLLRTPLPKAAEPAEPSKPGAK